MASFNGSSNNRNRNNNKNKNRHCLLTPGTSISVEGNSIVCTGSKRAKIDFHGSRYKLWYMASWNGDCVHAALNIQDVNDEATIKPNWAKRCSNLIIHRLPSGMYIESCNSYRELKQILHSRWSGKISGVELGFAEADDFETAAAYADANLEEDFSIGGASGNTNCTKFAMEFGMAIGYSRTHVNDAVMSLMAKIVPKRDQETLIDKLEQMSI